MFILCTIVIDTLNNFANIRGASPKLSKGKGTRTGFLNNKSKQIALNFFPRELKNMRVLSLGCTCNLLFATCISDFANLPF